MRMPKERCYSSAPRYPHHRLPSPKLPLKTRQPRALTCSPGYKIGSGLLAVCCTLIAHGARASTIEAINHTHWAINRFSVDGHSGLDVIGPYQGGGGGCCYVAPARWQPGMAVQIDWETGVAYPDGFRVLPIDVGIEHGSRKTMRLPASTAGSFPSLITPAKKCVASPSISFPAMSCRSLPPATPSEVPNTQSKHR